ncbi:MAG: hypothetical protein FWB96_03320 [Defluviitaleaceae bacterium]|nr:hypothetical protein [Defluviitaleaceae bacterium]MCL2261709.1 hypothetical protein [Defluviitaleaceae bacterium]
MTQEKIACAPQIGDYQVIANILISRCLGYKTIKCPPMTKRTLELGSRHSPDMICTPFKTTLGNFIEAAEQGANVFIMPGFGCRLGLYDILQQKVLTELGYDCEFVTLFEYIPTVRRMFNAMQEINPSLTQEKFDEVFALLVQVTLDMDGLAFFMRKNMAFAAEKNASQNPLMATYKSYLQEIPAAEDAEAAAKIGEKYRAQMESVPLNKPAKPIRIGIIGEIYIVVEPFSNCNMENWLADNGVEIIRHSSLSDFATAIFSVDEQIKNSGGYVDYNIGSTANDAISRAYEMIQEGIDGIIHVKPSSCSPEITAMSILQNISQDTGTPFMYMTFDTETGEAGVHTRLEAFLDMIKMRRPKGDYQQ